MLWFNKVVKIKLNLLVDCGGFGDFLLIPDLTFHDEQIIFIASCLQRLVQCSY